MTSDRVPVEGDGLTHGQSTTDDAFKVLIDWIREPDHAEEFSLAQAIDWINRRPLVSLYALQPLPTRPVPAPVGLEREEAISKAKAALHGVVSYLNADNDKHGARARSSTDSIIDKLVAALSPDHRTEPASAPIGQAEVKDVDH